MSINWASEKYATLVDWSSQIQGCDANHVLLSDTSKIWLTGEGLPQWICLHFNNIPENDKHGLVFKSIGNWLEIFCTSILSFVEPQNRHKCI